MSTKVAAPSPPSWANARTAVVADTQFAGPVVERGDLLYAALVDLLQVSLVRTVGDLRAAARSSDQLEGFLEIYEENRVLDLDVDEGELHLDPREDVREELIDWYMEILPAPWISDGGAGWELDKLIAEFATVSGASPGGNADWIQFNIGVSELAANLRGLGFVTVSVPPRVFEQFFGFPVDGIWLDEGELLPDSGDGAA